jgi:hypothetical protein
MPRGDGTGPTGQGPGTGRGQGRGRGQGAGNRPGAGPAGNCVCVNCGAKVPHRARVPCNTMQCPKCGAQMVRE